MVGFPVGSLVIYVTFGALTSVVIHLSLGRAVSLQRCASVLCGRYKDFLRGVGKLTSGTSYQDNLSG